LEAERDRSIARLNTIDRAKFDELAQQQTGLENELRSLAEEQRRLDRSEKRADTRRLEKAVAERAAAEREMLDRFQHVQSETDVSAWLPRLRELREEVCARLPAKDVAATEFAALFNRSDKAAGGGRVAAARRELAMTHASSMRLLRRRTMRLMTNSLRSSTTATYPITQRRPSEAEDVEKLLHAGLGEARNALFEVENTRAA
jgi:hypothetical protein